LNGRWNAIISICLFGKRFAAVDYLKMALFSGFGQTETRLTVSNGLLGETEVKTES